MHTRNRVITVVGVIAAIALLLWLPRCADEETSTLTERGGRPGSAGTRGTIGLPGGDPLGFTLGAPESRRRGPTLDELIAQGQRSGAGGTFPTPAPNSVGGLAMPRGESGGLFAGERVPPRLEATRPTPTARVSGAVVQGAGSVVSVPRPFVPLAGAGTNIEQQALAMAQQLVRSDQGAPGTATNPEGSATSGSGASGATPTSTGGGTGSAGGSGGIFTGAVVVPDTTGGAGGNGGSGGSSGGSSGPGAGGGSGSGSGPGGSGGSGGGGTGSGGTGTGGTGSGGSGSGGTSTNRRPVVASLGASPGFIAAGGPITLTATGVSDPDSALPSGGVVSSVQFFRDVNANAVLDVGTDELLATDSDGSNGFGTIVVSRAEWGAGVKRFFARAQDDLGLFSTPAGVTVTINSPPALGALSVSPGIVAPGGAVTLSASGALDADPAGGALLQVEFFFDSDGSGDLNAGDAVAGAASPVSGTASTVTIAPLNATGTLRYFARSVDEIGARSAPVTGAVQADRQPLIGGLSASPNIFNAPAGITLTATGLSDPDGDGSGAGLSRVEFFEDTNASGVFESGSDTIFASVTTTAGVAGAVASIPSGAMGTRTFFARAVDQLNLPSPARAVSVAINNPPTLTSMSASPALLSPGETLTLTSLGVADADPAGGQLLRVDFFRDSNDDGVLDAGDALVGSDTSGGASAVLSLAASADASGVTRYFASAVDQLGLSSVAASATLVVNRAPVVTALSAGAVPAPRVLGPVTLTATATDDDTAPDSVVSVAFFRDVDADGQVTGADVALGVDSDGTDGFLFVQGEAPAEWSPTVRVLARAMDTRGVSSAVFAATIVVGAFPDSVLRVRASAAPGGDGLSWGGAFDTIGAALTTAPRTGGVVTEVWVAGGTYPGSVALASSLRMLGGFAGSEAAPGERDWFANPTVLDGGGAGRVMEIPASVGSASVDGFTIRNGLADSGAGVRSAALTVEIAHCTFTGNTATGIGGGAVAILNAGPTSRIVNCAVRGNAAPAGAGGGVLLVNAPGGVLVANNTIVSNTSASGGGVHLEGGAPTIANCIVAFNSAGMSGASAANPTLITNDVFSNTSFAYQGFAAGATDIASDPRFVGLAAGDLRLLADSPCIDAGSNSLPPASDFSFDLAHRPRRVDGNPGGGVVIDMGALEASCVPPACPADITGDGVVNTADLVRLLSLFGTSVGPGTPEDLNGDGAVNTSDLVLLLGRFGATCPVCP